MVIKKSNVLLSKNRYGPARPRQFVGPDVVRRAELVASRQNTPPSTTPRRDSGCWKDCPAHNREPGEEYRARAELRWDPAVNLIVPLAP